MRFIRIVFFVFFVFVIACSPQFKKPEAGNAPQIRILLDHLSDRDSVVFNGNYTLESEEATYEFGKNNRIIYISPFLKGFKLFNENRIFVFRSSDRVVLTPEKESATFKFQDKLYQGSIYLVGSPDKSLYFITKTNLEEYLKGVVPAEMPSRNDDYLDALKAQAICSRTYALGRLAERKNLLFDVYDDHRDQVFNGLRSQTENGNMAVSSTRGDVLMYNDSLATIYYHSTCGGILEAAADRFGNGPYPYMPEAKDILGDEFTCQASPYFRWEKTFSLQQIDSLFRIRTNRSLLDQNHSDTLQINFDVRVLKRSPSGRIQNMQTTYGDETFNFEDYEIRSFFGDNNGRSLPSNLFQIFSRGDSVLVIQGGGFGHGVGMCQWGAMHMSERGFKYYDILVNKYFRGTYLKKVY